MKAIAALCLIGTLAGCALTASNDSRLSVSPAGLLQRMGRAAPAPAAAVAPFEVASSASTLKIFGSPGCASWTIGSDAEATTLQCVTGSTPPPQPTAPTCSSLTANPSAFPGATGSTTLTANCSGKLNGYEWSSTVAPVSGFAFNTLAAQSTQTPTIAANTTFAVRAFNGNTPSNTVSVAVIVNQQVSTNCQGFSNTRVYDIDWNAPRRVNTGALSQTEAVVIRFTTPPSNTGTYSDITGAEYGGPQTTRYATLSPNPCDFGEPPALGWGATASGSTVFLKFSIGPNSGGYYPPLNTSTTYYANIKTTAACSTCNMIFDLHK